MSTVHPLPARNEAEASVRRTSALPALGGLLVTDQAAEYLGLKPKTLVKDRCTREIGIPFVKIGRLARYRMADLEKFIAERVVA